MKPACMAMALAVMTGACATAPDRSGYLSSYDALTTQKGMRGKRLMTAPARDVPENANLVVEAVAFAPGADISDALTQNDRARLLNQFGRALCADLSRPFTVAPSPTPGAYRLRAAITRARATGRVAAAAATAMTLGLPLGIRPPVGLGAIEVEMEVLSPDGRQVAAMVWKQGADMASAGARVSRIGDAYDLAQSAADDFSQLFRDGRSGAGRLLGVRLGAPDAACKAYGAEGGVVGAALGLVGVAAPPEMTDRGRRKFTPPAR